ncbi:MAG: site-specific DNA-methyltransferase [Chloroflexi bacterium]|nr:site-specific DNA-methyltransferase [Chloroflexota bacterium]
MFPLEFPFKVIEKYSKPGELVIDPFAGRASSIYAAATNERHGLGIEINPLGWVYAQTKLNPAAQHLVEYRLLEISKSISDYKTEAESLNEFYHWCFSDTVLTFLLSARENLRWKTSKTDRTLMGLLLIYLHGKYNQALSNQMRHAKSMSQQYSINWWKNRGMQPPEINPYDFMLSRIKWRYAKGTPKIKYSDVKLGDSTLIFEKQAKRFSEKISRHCSLLFTSPPYYGITHYHKDQWLRLWLLGGKETALWSSEKHKGRFDSKTEYRELLDNVFGTAETIMDKEATIYIRTDTRDFTYTTTRDLLKEHFPKWKMRTFQAPVSGKTQTGILGNRSSKPGEIDIVLTK